MISAKVLPCILLIVVHLNWVEGICERYGNHCTAKRNGSTIYFGLMLSYPDPLGRNALTSVSDDGHDIAPAAYLAVEQINNRSHLLSDYQIKLLPLDGGCTVTERNVIGINNIACSCEPVVGIIGPSCGTSAELVGQFTSRDQFSMVTIHYGEQNMLGNRTIFPFAFGILGSHLITIQAFTDLIEWNNWTKVILLYSEDVTDFMELSAGIEQNLKNVPGFDVAFTSPIKFNDHFIPLQEARQSLARVIILLSSLEVTFRTLCLAFHEGIIFPKYQWVFKEQFEIGTPFSHEGNSYNCTEEDISTTIHGSINFMWSLRTGDDGPASVVYEIGYKNQFERNHYEKENNVNSMPVEWARGIYDAVWSLAFALNSSLDELSMDLTQIVPGSKELAQAIASHMPDIDFQGVSGRIDFDDETGFNTARRINIYQLGASKSSTLIGFYTSEALVIFNDTTPQFIKATFDERRVSVSIGIAIPFLIISVAMLLFAVPIQVINIIYHNHSAIKATSPKLNHLIFLGFYLTVVSMVLYTIIEAWPHTLNSFTLSNMCITLPWFINIGPTLVLGTVCVKTWRLHYIYTSAKRGVSTSSKRMADPALIGYVGAFVSIDVLLCLLWTCIDPLKYTEETALHESKEMTFITVTGSCRSSRLVFWTNVLIIDKYVLTVSSFILALPTKLGQTRFKTNNVVILSYILVIAFALGMSMYTIAYIIDISAAFRFIIKGLFVDTITCICLFTLFLPSVVMFARSFGNHTKRGTSSL